MKVKVSKIKATTTHNYTLKIKLMQSTDFSL